MRVRWFLGLTCNFWAVFEAKSCKLLVGFGLWGRLTELRKACPRGLKPLFPLVGERAKPEGLAYLEAEATAKATEG